MKKISTVPMLFLCMGVLFVSCQKEEIKQPALGEKTGQPSATAQKGTVESQENLLTEDEQKEFERIGGGGIPSPNLFKSKKDALIYLKILLKGNEKTIRWYANFSKEEGVTEKEVRRTYADDICTAMKAIVQNEEAFTLTLETMKNKATYPAAYACACERVGWYAAKEGRSKRVINAIPLLDVAIKNSNAKVRLEAAGSLLIAGESSHALPVLDELAKEGQGEALAKLFKPNKEGVVHWSMLTFWDERGRDIIKKALNYPSDEVKSWAAIALVSLGIEKDRAEKVALNIVKKYMDKTQKDYGLQTIDTPQGPTDVLLPEYAGKDILELKGKFIKDRWACWNAISALGRLKSKMAVSHLRHIRDNNTRPEYVCWENLADKTAQWALDRILENGGGK